MTNPQKRALPAGKDERSQKRAKANSAMEGRAAQTNTSKLDDCNAPYTAEQCYWIRFHYYQLNHAVTYHPAIEPKGTTSCAFFNAYFEGHPSDSTVEGGDDQVVYQKRTYVSFRDKRQEILPTTLKQISEKSKANRKEQGAQEFRPIITPSCLASFIKIYTKYAGRSGEFDFGNFKAVADMTAFLNSIVAQQFAPYKPTWLEDGCANILRRPELNMASYTARHLGELDAGPSAERGVWHRDHSTRDHSSDRMEATRGGTGGKEDIRMKYRNVHADVGNALLNMAVIRPRGYDGDLNALVRDGDEVDLPGLSEEQLDSAKKQVEAVMIGDQLRKRVFDQAVWPPEKKDTDKAAGVRRV
ncbi:hypothetical protein SLS59_008647 [Nothophoma quercina]|uniref:Uncharacterized protein n=1 Tax=Nothophoma quercina TaxID=749835 RepID=A0ABR3QRP8_9PLEO